MNFKLFNVAILSVLVMASCSKDEVVSNADTSLQNAISFNALGSKAQTKATPITSANLTTTDFDVFAFTQDGKAFMGNVDTDFAHDGVKIVYKNNKWDYDKQNELAYWPTTDNPLDFYAISPATLMDAGMHYMWNFNHDSQKIFYSCMDEYAEGTGKHEDHDVMYGIAKSQTKNTNNGVVKFTFKHILSQIVFKARTELENMNVTIKVIKIRNVKMSGTFTLPADANTHATTANWELPAGLTLGYYSPTVIRNANVEVNSNTTVTDISNTTPIFTIPQTLTKWVVSGDTKTKEKADIAKQSYLEIECKIEQNGLTLHNGTLYVPFGVSWEPGYRYIYTLVFGGGYNDEGDPILTPINFDADVEEWADEEMDINTTVGGVN